VSNNQELLYVAQLGKSIGLKGEIKLHIISDFIEQFKPQSIFFDEKSNKYIIEKFNQSRKIVKLQNINTIEEATPLTNTKLYSSIEFTKKNCKLSKDEYFYFDILECQVIENDISLGVIAKIDRFCNSDYFLINTDKKLIDKKLPSTFLIPYEDFYIKNVDIKNKKIIVQNSMSILEQS